MGKKAKISKMVLLGDHPFVRGKKESVPLHVIKRKNKGFLCEISGVKPLSVEWT